MNKLILLILSLSLTFTQISDYTFIGSEASALAGAVVSDKGHSWSVFHNPAGISEIPKAHMNAGGAKLYGYSWLSTNHFSLITNLPKMGKIGFGLFQLETKNGETVLSNEQRVSIAHAFILQKDKNSTLSVGYKLNYNNWFMAPSAGTSGDGTNGISLGYINSYSIDIGMLSDLRKKYRLGAYLTNVTSNAIGNGMTRIALPKRINVGLTYIPITQVATSISAERTLGFKKLILRSAFRYQIDEIFELLIGLQSNPNLLGVGGTLSLGNQAISYSILTHPVLPITHQISFGFYQ